MIQRGSTVTEANGRPFNEQETAKSMAIFANALQGIQGFGDWLHDDSLGWYVRQGSIWSAKIAIQNLQTLTIAFPFRIVQTIISVYDLTNPVIPSITQSYIIDSKYLTLSASLLNKSILIEFSQARIVRD